jgi:uncharacterized protein (TIGR02444 family)
MTQSLQNHPFCRFSDQVKQQAEQALISLKDRHDLNIDMLLFCYWFAINHQGLLSKTHFKHLLSAIYAWHQKIVSPLTMLCTQLKNSIANRLWPEEDTTFESAISALAAAEQIEQSLIADVLPKKIRRGRTSLQQVNTHACLNVLTYCQTIYICLDEKDYHCLSKIAAAALPDLDATKILSFIRNTLSGRQTKQPLQKNLPLFESD